nr:TrkH family potassium uptake protein [Helicobacter burdigaliensis]
MCSFMNRYNARYLLIAYTLIAFIGALLLVLPPMHKSSIDFIDAFFMTTSAVSVTGLIVKNTGADFTFFGQLVLICIIQIGGFGYMSVTSFVYLLLRKKIDYKNRQLIKDNLSLPTMQGTIGFIKKMFILVLLIEAVGALLLSMRFMLEYPFLEAVWLGIFHSISAFNNAGFSVFESGLMAYRDDLAINLIITTLIIAGGLGYLVLLECYYRLKRKNEKLSTHTKTVLITTAFLIIVAFLSVFLLEYKNPKSIGEFSLWQKILSSYFAAVNYRTSGFNTLDLSLFQDASLFFGSIFMVIGGAPGGTAGGIKVTTFAILFIYTFSILRNSKEAIVFHRTIAQDTINRAFVIVALSSVYISVCVMILSLFENGGSRGFLALLFEVCSAFGTVGLSMGDGGILSLSANFDSMGKFIIILLMLSGKVGVLAFALSIVVAKKKTRISYPETKILI